MFLALALANAAFAQQIDLPPMKEPAVEGEVQRVDFTDPTDVTAAVNRPSLEMTRFRTPAAFNSLVKLRSDFAREVDQSARQVR